MFPCIVILAVGAFALSRIVRWRRRGRFYPREGRFGGRYFLRRLTHKLDLDREQRREIEALSIRVRDHIRGLRSGARAFRGALADALAGETFDRSQLDEIAGQTRTAFDEARVELLAGLARVHEILTPLQRERLRDLLRGSGAGRGHAPAPAAGPYR